MRPNTQQRLDALIVRQRWQRIMFFGAILAIMLALGGLWVGLTHAQDVATMDAVVERSVIGSNEFGQKIHTLRAKLDSGIVVPVSTHSATPLQLGAKIKVVHRRSMMGYNSYVLQP